ncbi:hypothetical protein CEP52_017470 [Fusarium oligoseptatum]|uniref:Uncharacterized protein n=1 Tax=Fusarium oligoseptatum TaxID=2604345 RepID=A0A428RQU2_9HYPO|nr:hypothetical protein CEP52_017470 [Fusarium oligoseptatum]
MKNRFKDTGELTQSDTYSRGNGVDHKDDIHMEDSWPNESEVEYAAEGAVEMWLNQADVSKLHIGQWKAINTINPKSEMSPSAFLWIRSVCLSVSDEIDWNPLSTEAYAMAISLDLNTMSENCGVNPDKGPPLLPKEIKSQWLASGEQRPQWNRSIYANGTSTTTHQPTCLWATSRP